MKMRAIVPCFLPLLLILSCTGLPKPQYPNDTLLLIPVSFESSGGAWIWQYRLEFEGLPTSVYVFPTAVHYIAVSGLPVGHYSMKNFTIVPLSSGYSSPVEQSYENKGWTFATRAHTVTMADFFIESRLEQTGQYSFSQSFRVRKVETADKDRVLSEIGGNDDFNAWTNGFSNQTETATISWLKDDNGSLQFKTNDPDNEKKQFWMHTALTEPEMTTVTVEAQELSGAVEDGYGAVFCYQDEDDFYSVMISSNGYFSVWKKAAGSYTTLKGWTRSANLKAGLGVSNTISVAYKGSDSFSVFLNDLNAPDFDFTDPGAFTNGSAGLFVMVSGSTVHKFPQTALDVRFKMTAPLSIP